MVHHTTRRTFLATTAATALGLAGPCLQDATAATQSAASRKSLIGPPDRQTLEQHKSAGFGGLEATLWDVTPEEAARCRQTAEELQMRIHSLLRGWTDFNSPDAQTVQSHVASVDKALHAAQAYGADALLLVPCRLLAKVDIPRPEDFEIELREPTGHITRVVAGDNAPYEGYIQAHNQAIDMARRAVEKLIPVAERTKVVIALENVWSNLWVKPRIFAHFVRSFGSPWVQSYFDIGNHVKYAAPEEWIETLGKTIVKVHVKDFVVDRAKAQGGTFVNIREGDVNWPSVMKALQAVGYQGWMTIEGSGDLSLEERSKRLDLILAGK